MDGGAAPDLRLERVDHRWIFATSKRIFDCVLAMVLFVLCAPLIGVLWILIVLDGGPGFHLQDRVGRNGKSFRMIKLRTMIVDAEGELRRLCATDSVLARAWHSKQKLDNDPRVTWIGKLLRRTSLDELPQIWNILMGEMSFVGPRPIMTQQLRLYASEPGAQAYFNMRPGLTGPWQVSESRGCGSFLTRIAYDNAYLRDASFAYDLMLILRTIRIVFTCRGS